MDAIKTEYGMDVFVFKVWGNTQMLAGLPDLIGCVKGRFFGLEVKLPESKTRVSGRQLLVHGWIQRAGGICGVVTTKGEALELLADA